MKKKIILLTIIICTLLCGCQPKNPNAATATVTGSELQGSVTDEYVSPADEEPPPYDIPMTDGTEASSIFAVPTTGAAATVTVTAGSRVTSPATKPHTTAVKPTSPRAEAHRAAANGLGQKNIRRLDILLRPSERGGQDRRGIPRGYGRNVQKDKRFRAEHRLRPHGRILRRIL